jgi:hypothetical protein
MHLPHLPTRYPPRESLARTVPSAVFAADDPPAASGGAAQCLERFPFDLNRDSQKGRKGRVLRGDLPFRGAMARPYSSDLRERVVEAVNEGAIRHEAAERFDISVSSAVRWHQA